MNNDFQYSTVSYAILHKPTNQWVQLKQDDEYPHLRAILFVNSFEGADKFPSELIAKLKLQEGYVSQERYGKTNFLEFVVLKFKTTYTLEPNERAN